MHMHIYLLLGVFQHSHGMYVCEISWKALMPVLLCTCNGGKYDKGQSVFIYTHVFFMTFGQFLLCLTNRWGEAQITMAPSIQRPRVVAQSMDKVDSLEEISPSGLEWFYSNATQGISQIRASKWLAAHELIPLTDWPTCYWEMTCFFFFKLHHEAEMINGLKSDKRI